MKNIILKCQDCKTVLEVNAKDLWRYVRCTICGSYNVVNLDEEFDQAEIMGDE